MGINLDAIGMESEPHESSWDSKDCLLYSLGVGAGATDPTGFELEFTTENTKDITQKALPTMCVILGGTGGRGPLAHLGDVNYSKMVHGEQGIILHKPLPTQATVTSTSKVSNIYDKGKAALVILETTAIDTSDNLPVFTNISKLFFRDEGGWGGERGPMDKVIFPERDADSIVSYETRNDQALLYRLNGDRNPLHSDPSFAALGGFSKPILHGLCTYGFTGRALVHLACDGDPEKFKSMDGRFSSPVIPGEKLEVHVWEDEGDFKFRTIAGDRVVLDNGVLQTR
ncbi:MAG: enoyl-CoA hydratase [Acidimicrobiaceae bacterium]|jgi:acyl dehydratase|nr:enoyl-CoA hydratase [Acidimicrobiaceae bacterium]|tara:strand:+ start:8984 stop:9838 length:855 start_codon:yes stop_codon:yes gene_type:complete